MQNWIIGTLSRTSNQENNSSQLTDIKINMWKKMCHFHYFVETMCRGNDSKNFNLNTLYYEKITTF